MAITKNIVDMMNGTIEVKSEQGVGTEFLVSSSPISLRILRVTSMPFISGKSQSIIYTEWGKEERAAGDSGVDRFTRVGGR